MTVINAAFSKPQIEQAIKLASQATGIDFDYLLATASRESSLNPQAKSKTSSASGLFQFIERTWLDMVRRYGSEIGLGALSNEITTSSRGAPSVADGQKMQEILALRHDPEISAFMAGKLTEESRTVLEGKLGRPATEEDLYLAHFFGAVTASRFIEQAEQNPSASASQYFPNQASANRSVFYRPDGTAKTLDEVRAHLTLRSAGEANDAMVLAQSDNFQYSLFSNLRPSLSPFESDVAAPALRPSQKHFLLSPEVVQALSELRLPQSAKNDAKSDERRDPEPALADG